ncbi:CoA-binding protein, partial [Mycobacterium tuberculosis]|nr:CoA-binding protein [Mycobacterium tuberculosis]
AVPAPAAPDVMMQLGRAGTRAAVVFTSGFAEVSGGEALQHALADQARAHGVQLLGPNCLGAMNLRGRMYATFSPMPFAGVPPVGEVGLVSQ